jgi:predicted lactoylglutathione lyase
VIGYVTLGTNNLDKAAAFYDALLAELGAKRLMEDKGRIIGWGTQPGSPMLMVTRPHDGKPATVGNGVMVALNVGSPDAVKKIHAKALQLGGTDEGQPGPRGTGGFHGGYFRDLDGNKLVAFCMAR